MIRTMIPSADTMMGNAMRFSLFEQFRPTIPFTHRHGLEGEDEVIRID